jgi:hypothetical protein
MLVNYWCKLWLDMLFPELQEHANQKVELRVGSYVDTLGNSIGKVIHYSATSNVFKFQSLRFSLLNGNIFTCNTLENDVLLLPIDEILGTYSAIDYPDNVTRLYDLKPLL